MNIPAQAKIRLEWATRRANSWLPETAFHVLLYILSEALQVFFTETLRQIKGRAGGEFALQIYWARRFAYHQENQLYAARGCVHLCFFD